MGENVLPIKNNSSPITNNNGREQTATELEQIVLAIEKTMSRCGGQIIKSVENIHRNKPDSKDSTATLIEESLSTQSHLTQEIALLKEAVVNYGLGVSQISEHLTNQQPVTKEQLNQAVNFFIGKLPSNDLVSLRQEVNKLTSLVSNLANNQNNNQSNLQNNSLQVIITELSTLQKQQRSQQTQLDQILTYLANSNNEQPTSTPTITTNDGNGNSNNGDGAKTAISKLTNKFSSHVKAITPNGSSQQKQTNKVEEKYYSIPATPYQISAKALKQIALVLIGIVFFLIIFK